MKLDNLWYFNSESYLKTMYEKGACSKRVMQNLPSILELFINHGNGTFFPQIETIFISRVVSMKVNRFNGLYFYGMLKPEHYFNLPEADRTPVIISFTFNHHSLYDDFGKKKNAVNISSKINTAKHFNKINHVNLYIAAPRALECDSVAKSFLDAYKLRQ